MTSHLFTSTTLNPTIHKNETSVIRLGFLTTITPLELVQFSQTKTPLGVKSNRGKSLRRIYRHGTGRPDRRSDGPPRRDNHGRTMKYTVTHWLNYWTLDWQVDQWVLKRIDKLKKKKKNDTDLKVTERVVDWTIGETRQTIYLLFSLTGGRRSRRDTGGTEVSLTGSRSLRRKRTWGQWRYRRWGPTVHTPRDTFLSAK